MPRHLDEDDVRIRPRGSSRPRTRRRPEHAEAVPAMVLAVHRGRYSCLVDGTAVPVLAVRAGRLRSDQVVVGDRVELIGDGAESVARDQAGAWTPSAALARIVRRSPRTSLLRRTADDTDAQERPVVANAELLAVVTSVADPPPRPRFVDRCLVAAYDGGLTPLLVVSKSDLGPAAALRRYYRPVGIQIVEVARDQPLDELVARLHGRTTVLFGASGVGKSTLVNRLVPDANRETAAVGSAGRGRHVTSAAVMLRLPDGGWVVDTPGVRSLGLAGFEPARLLAAFPDLADLVAQCPQGCHHPAASGCALERVPPALAARVSSYRRLLASTSTVPPVRQ